MASLSSLDLFANLVLDPQHVFADPACETDWVQDRSDETRVVLALANRTEPDPGMSSVRIQDFSRNIFTDLKPAPL